MSGFRNYQSSGFFNRFDNCFFIPKVLSNSSQSTPRQCYVLLIPKSAVLTSIFILEIPTIVISFPLFITLAFPSMFSNSSFGTSPSSRCSQRCSMMSVGYFPLTAAVKTPLASRGKYGIATRKPGICAKSDCKLCECWLACPQPRPIIARIVIGAKPFFPVKK